MNSLEFREEKKAECVPSPCCHSEPSYPSLCLRGNQVEAFLQGMALQGDKTYQVTIEFSVEGYNSKYGKSLDLCVKSAGEITEAGSSESEDEGESEDEDVIAKLVIG